MERSREQAQRLRVTEEHDTAGMAQGDTLSVIALPGYAARRTFPGAWMPVLILGSHTVVWVCKQLRSDKVNVLRIGQHFSTP